MTLTPEMIEAAARAMCEAWHYAKIGTPDGNAEWSRKKDQYRKQAEAALSAALSVPAAAVVGEPVGDIAYNAGLEIRYAIAASGVDPIQHIPEVDAIIERRLAEARKAAFIEAAEIAEETAQGSDHLLKAAGQAKDIQGALVHGEGVMTARIIATALRAKAEETDRG